MNETGSSKRSIVEIKDITAGAGALGLLGYGMPGVLTGLANAGLIQAGSMIIAMAIFMGGVAMFTAGLMEWKKGNTYGMAAYASYGLFWFSFAALTLLPALGLAESNRRGQCNGFLSCSLGALHPHPVYRIIKNVSCTPVCARDTYARVLP